MGGQHSVRPAPSPLRLVARLMRQVRWYAVATIGVVMAVLAPSLIVDAPASATTPGPVSQVVFVTPPSGASGGLAFSQQPTVAYEDANGNIVTTENDAISLSLVTTIGGALDGCSVPTPTNGETTATGCYIDQAGSYKIEASGDGFSVEASLVVAVGPPAQARFSQNPTDIDAGQDFASSVAVTIEDAGGNTVTATTDDVGLFVDPTSSALSCTGGELTQNTMGQALPDGGVAESAVDGVATFPDCTVTKSVSGSLALDAVITDGTTQGTFSAVSSSFTVTTGIAYQLAFLTEPTGAQAGFDFSSQPVVAIEDSSGNVVSTASATISLAIKNDTSGATLSCSTEPTVEGVAYFSGCGIDTAGSDYVLTATGDSFSVDSDPFVVSASGAGGLSFTDQPGNGDGGEALSTQPEVSITDSYGDPISGSVQLSLTNTSGQSVPGATISCTDNPTPAGEGTAQFAGCAVNLAGTYKLVATDPDDPTLSAASDPFTVSTGAAVQLAFVDAPDGGTGGSAFGTQPAVALQDAGGNDVASTDSVELSIAPGTGSPGAQITCDSDPLQIDGGTNEAAFTGCSIDKAGVGYEITATTAGYVVTSAPFDVTIGAARRLVFVTQPSGGIVGSLFSSQPRVAVADAGGNPIGSADDTVTLTSTGSLACASASVPTESSTGVATFDGCSSSTTGADETLTASAPGLLSATSAPFAVTAGTALGVVPVALPLAQSFGGATYARNPTSTVDDVNTMSGELELSYTDLTVAGIGEPFVLTRTYNSQDTTGGSFGPGWTSLLDAGVTITGTTATVRGTDGQRVVFTSNGHGQWIAPAGARESLTCSTASCIVTLVSGVTFTSVGGRIQSFVSRDGEGLKFLYAGARLTAVQVERSTTPLTITVSENASGEVTALSTPTRSVYYGYTGTQLTSYTDADGDTWTYGYVAGGLYEVTDPTGTLRLMVTYSGDRVATAQSLGGSGLFDDSYSYSGGTTVRAATVETAYGLVAADHVDTYLSGVLVAQETPTGGVTTYSYDNQLDLTETQNPLGLIESLTYDAFGDILTQSVPFSATRSALTTFAYNAAHQLTSDTDPNGHTTTYQWSGGNLVRSQAPAPAGAITYKYNVYDERTEADGPLGITTYSYDPAGNETGFEYLTLTRVSLNGLGPFTTFNEAGQILTQTDARGHTSAGINAAYTTYNTYDPDGNLLSSTTPGPNTTSTTYDAAGNVLTTTSPAGLVTTDSWDQGDLTSTSTNSAGTTSVTYDPSGDILDNAQGQVLTYDVGGDELTMTGTDGVVTSYTYDVAGDAVGSTDSAGHSSSVTYGANGQVASSTVNGVTTTTTYDPAGNVLTTTDNAGHVTSYTYNADELVASVTTSAGTTHYVYDGDGNLVQMVDGDGHVTYYTYNAANERTSMVVNGSTWTYRYDLEGNLVSTTDPVGRTTTYTLNAVGLPTTTTYSEPGQSTITVTDTYNAAGQRTSMTDPTTGTHTYSYDAAGNLTAMDNGTNDTFTYDYSTPGQMTETYPDGNTVTYTYDDEHNVMSVESGAVDVSYLRNTDRQITGATYSNGLVETDGYNAQGEQVSQTLSCAGAVVEASGTSYDADGNPLATQSTDGITTTTDSYGYDGTNRVDAQQQSSVGATTSWDPGAGCTSGTESSPDSPNGGDPTQDSTDTTTPGSVGGIGGFTETAPTSGTSANALAYDAVGNRLSGDGTSYSYNTANELTSTTGANAATYVYDASGDLVRKVTGAGTTTYAYNAANELTSVTTPTSTTTYTYDGDGNRVSRTVTGAGATSELYLWDVNAATPLLAEETTTSYALVREYLYGAGLVAVVTPSATYYTTTDATGDVTGVANQAGALLETINYDAFGTPSVTTIDDAMAVTEPILFQGQYLDPTTGLYDLRARNYDPTTGRFTQRDVQIAETGTPVTSPYVYAGDMPTTQSDPTGESFSSAADSALNGHSTESASIVADASYGVKAIKILRSAYIKISSYSAKVEGEAAGAEKFAAGESAEVGEFASGDADEIGEIAADDGGAAADSAGKLLGVIGIGLGVYVTYADCNAAANGGGASDISKCIGDAVGVVISTICLVATEGVGSVACGIIGAALSVVISEYGPEIAEGAVDLYQYAVEGVTYVYGEIAEGFADAGAALSNFYDSTRDSIDAGISALTSWASSAYATAAGAIRTGFDKLGSDISSGFDAALAGLEKAGYDAVQMADFLKDQFNEGVTDVLEWLNSLQYGASAALGVLKNVYGDVAAEAAKLMEEASYTLDQIGTALTNAFTYGAKEVAGVFESIGTDVTDIVSVLHGVFGDLADDAASVLNQIGYGFQEIGTGIKGFFHTIDSDMIGVMDYIGVAASDTMQLLNSLYSDPVQTITNLFEALGTDAEDAAQDLLSAFGLPDTAVATLLNTAGYAVDDIASAIESVFTDGYQAVAQILENLGYAASVIENWLSNVAGQAVSTIENILSDIGFSSSVIDAIGGAFSSFGSDVVSGLESLGDDIASLF